MLGERTDFTHEKIAGASSAAPLLASEVDHAPRTAERRVTRLPTGEWALIALRLALAVTVAASASLVLTDALPRAFAVRSDIVGYPAFRSFPVARYSQTYLLWVGVFPVIALVVYVALRRTLLPPCRDETRTVTVAAPLPKRRSTSLGARLSPFGACAATAGAFAVEVLAAGPRVAAAHPWPTLGGAFATCLAATLGSAMAFRRVSSLSLGKAAALLNALLAPLLLLGLYVIARRTHVLLVDSGQVVGLPWLALWAAAVLAAIAWIAVAVSVRRAGLGGIEAVSRRCALFIAAPLIVFLCQSRLPGAMNSVDFFHDGERLVGAKMLLEGARPYRDFIPVHGILIDGLSGALGMRLFGESVWSLRAADFLFLSPMFVAVSFLLCARLFQRSGAFVLLAGLVVSLSPPALGGFAQSLHPASRFVLLPLALLAFLAFLSRGSASAAAMLAILLLASAILTPESAAMVLLAPAVTLANDWTLWRRGEPRAFRRTKLLAACLASAAAVAAGSLWAMGWLSEQLAFFAGFSSGHDLTGGVPVQWSGFRFAAGVYAIPAVVVLVFAYTVWRIRSRRPPTHEDVAVLALALFAGAYYLKFLARADEHLYQVVGVAIPLFFYAVYRAAELVDDAASIVFPAAGQRLLRPTTVVALVLAPIVLFPGRPVIGAINATVVGLPSHYRVAIPDLAAPVPKLGFAEIGEQRAAEIRDLRALFDGELADLAVYDFANQPALYHFVLGEDPVSRYTNASIAIRLDAQRELISDLERRRPEIVALWGGLGLPGWDHISNLVRHHEVSEWLLRHYRPWIKLHSQVLYARADFEPEVDLARLPPEAVGFDDLAFMTAGCDWGYVPEHLDIGSRLQPDDSPLSSRPVGALVEVSGRVAQTDAGRRFDGVAAIEAGRVVSTRPLPSAGPQSFSLVVPLETAPLHDAAPLELYLLSGESAYRVSAAGGLAPPLLGDGIEASGRRYRLNRQQVAAEAAFRVLRPDANGRFHVGWTEKPVAVTALSVPSTLNAASGFVLHSNEGLAPGRYLLSDDLPRDNRSIAFAAEAGNRSLTVRTGACSQWFGWSSPTLLLQQEGDGAPPTAFLATRR